MGRNLTSLYISQSFQYLTQISGSELQDGLGNTITGSLNITASLADTATSASYATTASYVLNAVSASYATNALSSSFATTASYALNAGTTVSTASLLTTASAVNNVITFTKGDGSTFPVTVNTGSGATVDTGSLLVTASISNATTTFTKGDGSTFSITANNVVNANSASVATSASYALSASQAQNATTASFALTIADNLSPTFTNVTASNVLITGTASVAFLNTTTISSSVIFTSGSNQLGDNPTLDTQTLFGKVIVTGSLASTGSAGFTGGDFKVTDQTHNGEFDVDAFKVKTQTGTQFTGSVSSQNGFTGSLQGTASYASNALSSSYAVSASYAPSLGPEYGFQGLTSGSINYTFLFSDTASNAMQMTFIPNSSGKQVWEMTEQSGSIYASYGLTYTNANNAPGYIANKGDVIFGGARHTYEGQGSSAGTLTMIGGLQNKVKGGSGHYGSSMIGGAFNYMNWNYPANGDRYVLTMVGGQSNEVGGSNFGTIVGGAGNTIKANGYANSIFGGQSNTIEANQTQYDAIIGGLSNTIDTNTLYSGIFVGQNNYINANLSYSAIIGGSNITASANNTVYTPNLNVTGSLTMKQPSGADILLYAEGVGPYSRINGNGPSISFTSNQAGGGNVFDVSYKTGSFSGLVKVGNGLQVTGSTTTSGSMVIQGTNAPALVISSSARDVSTMELWAPDGTQTYLKIRDYGFNPEILSSRQFSTMKILSTNGAVSLEDNFVVYPGSTGIYSYAKQVISGSLDVSGSATFANTAVFSGSVRGEVRTLSISSNTASLDCSTDNFFTLTLVSGSTTHINPTNILPGQTINLLINTTGSGLVSFPSSVKQVSGSVYTPTTGSGTLGKDIVTFISFDTSSLYLSNVKNLI